MVETLLDTNADTKPTKEPDRPTLAEHFGNRLDRLYLVRTQVEQYAGINGMPSDYLRELLDNIIIDRYRELRDLQDVRGSKRVNRKLFDQTRVQLSILERFLAEK